jgi:hypothetical protein
VQAHPIILMPDKERAGPLFPDSDKIPQGSEITRCANFSREPAFLLLGLSYMRDLPTGRADSLEERIDGVDGGDGYLIKKPQSDA